MKPLSSQDAAQAVIQQAVELGLDRVGFAPASPPPRAEFFRRWLAEGRAGTMTYLNRSVERRVDPQKVLPGARTIIMAGQSYFTENLPPALRADPSRGVIAAYAWGEDYHRVLLAKLKQLAEAITRLFPGRASVYYVDTGPVLERDFAEQAGLGFVGKNTLLIAPRMGSLLFLGEILTTAELPPSPAIRMPSCGSCTRCLAACPTGALISPHVLDARLCISYLTIEYQGIIPRELRSLMGNHVFGCDDCQDCCPWNDRFATVTREPAYHGDIGRKAPPLSELAGMMEEEFRTRFGGSAVLRPGYACFLRNVAVALGNWLNEAATESLSRLARSSSSLVRLHAAWALGQTPGGKARMLLEEMAAHDSDLSVHDEAAWALKRG
ncbi:MAG: tRNA epoxyqueuosine(34) reductase QueG [bacterium]|nr:tRNA epoxyqueuosine(34) reductase QueG [bacterium]